MATGELAIEQTRNSLRSIVAPRTTAREYRITTAAASRVLTWGHAMAYAQKSLRNGALIHPHANGAFTLTRRDGTNPVRWSPEIPGEIPGQTEHDQYGNPTTPDGGHEEYCRSMATRSH